MFSSKNFIVSGLKFRFLINFEFIFVYGILILFFYKKVAQFSQYHLFKRLLFSTVYFCLLCHRLTDHGYMVFLFCSIGKYFCFLCQCHVFLMNIALQYSLKSESLIPPAHFSFLRIFFFFWLFWVFHMSMNI